MDKVNTPTVNLPESNLPINEIKPKGKEPNSNTTTNILISIFILSIILLIGGIAYLFYTNKIDIPTLGEITNSVENDVNNETAYEKEDLREDVNNDIVDENVDDWNDTLFGSIQDKSSSMNEYYNDSVGISFVYPKTWIVKEGDCYDEYFCKIRFIEDGQSESYFEYNLGLDSGFSFCLYSDANPFKDKDSDEITNSYYMFEDDYTKIDKEDTLRRGYISDSKTYMICEESSAQPNFYTNFLNPGFVLYKVDKDRSDLENILNIMDSILLSYEYFGEYDINE